ncbi:MAG: multifunctional CCA addition/repair protein [Gammaproteobacteria bacterium]
MKTYLVGGAVRDSLLGLPIKERDWVVVGATVQQMLDLGFKPVGKEFPVFLHPKTKDEYALARTEKKVGRGYHGFEFYASPDVTLEEDLKRRDLTINAIAQDDDGTIIDPFHGQKDLKNKILRHVSDAFAEDPVRILRVARFAARFADFKIAAETLQLMKNMVDSGEVDALVPERVWQELERALSEKHPERFIEVLRSCNALKIIFPEIDNLFGVPNPIDWHPEIDSGIHTLLTLKMAVKLSDDPIIRFAILLHDLGKTKTSKELLPKHHGHEKAGVSLIKTLCERLHVPRKYQDLAELVARYHGECHKTFELTPNTVLRLLEKLDAFRRPERFEKFLIACEADVRGRLGFENKPYPEADHLRKIFAAIANIDNKKIVEKFSGQQIAQAIHDARLKIIVTIHSSSRNAQ